MPRSRKEFAAGYETVPEEDIVGFQWWGFYRGKPKVGDVHATPCRTCATCASWARRSVRAVLRENPARLLG